jgi:2-polyprenyl-3-methyl-5-hydroxy-6-metoxy-1,4-benzoquinol methylase
MKERTMPVRVDPENNETRALFGLADFAGQKVLEIGCGDGRLTRRYAGRAAHVTAHDPFAPAIGRARQNLPPELQGRVDFQASAFEDFAAASPAPAFDLVLLSWSLC